MKPDIKFLSAFTWLAWFYLLCVAVTDMMQFKHIGANMEDVSLLDSLQELTFSILLFYLARILVAYHERQLIVNAFYVYAAAVLVGICSLFMKDYEKYGIYLSIIGCVIIFAFINLAIQLFKVRTKRLKKPYKNFALALIVLLSAKALAALGFSFISDFQIPQYQTIMAYINLTELLVPVSIIIIFNATKALQKNPEDSSGPNVVYV